MQAITLLPFKIWILLIAGPALFLLAIMVASIYFSARNVAATELANHVTALTPHILFTVLLSLGLLLIIVTPKITEIWRVPYGAKLYSDILLGIAVGAILATIYLQWLSPLLKYLQTHYGDYVPAGSVLPTLSGSLLIFFLANVLLAPAVEETLYRGLALPQLTTAFGAAGAVVITCIFFGLLHWLGGFWYMLLTGIVAGGVFAGLYTWREGIIAPYVAHLTLNIIEFLYAWRTQHLTMQ